jgi:hypothetical protein
MPQLLIKKHKGNKNGRSGWMYRRIGIKREMTEEEMKKEGISQSLS